MRADTRAHGLGEFGNAWGRRCIGVDVSMLTCILGIRRGVGTGRKVIEAQGGRSAKFSTVDWQEDA